MTKSKYKNYILENFFSTRNLCQKHNWRLSFKYSIFILGFFLYMNQYYGKYMMSSVFVEYPV